MNHQSNISIERTTYAAKDCQIGLVHLGLGAFHRAHQAVYIDDYMEKTGDLNWGIAAVNLRAEESGSFADLAKEQDGYLLKTTTPDGVSNFRLVRSHIHFEDWAYDKLAAENLLSLPSVTAVSMTVTESGYYLKDDWTLNTADPILQAEIAGNAEQSIYAYLACALTKRMDTIDAPITVMCCDNIRSNGEKLERNFKSYLHKTGNRRLADWLDENATFPNSMVDRITPRATDTLRVEVAKLAPMYEKNVIHGESFIQWVLQDSFAATMPALEKAGVEIVDDVDPYEETKIRILNGGHTALCYMGALEGHQTFDEAIANPKLCSYLDNFEIENVLPSITIDLPFSKTEYCDLIKARFLNAAIADDLSRICMDGWSKFPIFIRPTIKSCLDQGISPIWGYLSIASWYVYARRFADGKMHINYVEPYWGRLKPLLEQGQEESFARSEALWSDLPEQYEEFVPQLVAAIERVEKTWPI